MKKRQIIIVVAAVAILLVGRLISNKLGEPKDQAPRPERTEVTTVFVKEVMNRDIPIYVETTGVLKAIDRTELFSEVQGVMLPDGGRFRPGTAFGKGEILLTINADNQRAQVVAARSNFQRLVSSIIPDLKLDFTADFDAWNDYLKSIDVNKSLDNLPGVKSEQLKLFLTGRNIYSEFYAVRNQEILLSKYSIRAPYTGVLIDATVTPGTLIRQGQLLGVFIKPNHFELEASINADLASRLNKGQDVELKLDAFSNRTWIGKIVRVNNAVDVESQTSQFYVNLFAKDLKDGAFMQARVKTSEEPDAFEIPRSVIFDKNQVFIVSDQQLVQRVVTVLHLNEQTAIVRGLEDGMQVLTKVPTGAFEGMKVEIYSENEGQ